MHGILPSEIARLVLDYLEASSCPEAARLFLETSPDLQECRRVAASGGRFITRVFGLTLMNILHTFCDIYGLVQERLNRIDDNEQLRRCGDLCEQLRTLIDGCRGQRILVDDCNNVPTHRVNHMTGGSPIITSSIRKRRHSGPSNREKSHSVKSHSLPNENDNETPTNRWNNNYIESSKDRIVVANPTTNFKKSEKSSGASSDEVPVQCSSTVGETASVQSSQDDCSKKSRSEKIDDASSGTQNDAENETEKNSAPEKLSTGTDTQELMKYSTAEVQTTPYDMIESESEITDEPVENLSLLTKELLNRTEIHEKIAENINKAILPTDGSSLKDISFSDWIGASECNTSIMTDLNNAIKSIVTATQSDPMFEKFFDEIFQPEIEGEQSLDEDVQRNNHLNESLSDESPRTMDEFPRRSESDKENNIAVEVSPNDKNSQLTVGSETAQVNTELVNSEARITTATTTMTTIASATTTTTTSITENQALEDFNAAAVQSIINANNKSSEEMVIEIENSCDKQLNSEEFNSPTTNTDAVPRSTIPEENGTQNHEQIPVEHNLEVVSAKIPSSKLVKSTRKSKMSEQKLKPKLRKTQVPIPIPLETVVTVPTLIVCNKNDIKVAAPVPPLRPFNNIEMTNNICAGQKSQYVPIAPKEPGYVPPSTIYLRTVNVAKKVPTVNSSATKLSSEKKSGRAQNSVTPNEKSKETKSTNEAITLYGINENNSGEILESPSLPTINIEESVPFSGSGLSPFLKFNKKLPQLSNVDESTRKNITVDNNNTVEVRTSDCDITKRTPKSLLKSRAMNHRLSLSTPRRRSGHIRALDFNTPPKEINASRRLSEADACPFLAKSADNPKPICRTSLFKSPPFENSPIDRLKNSQISHSIKAPSADSSPVPKLYGGWDKVSGVGTILGNVSPSIPTARAIMSGKNDSSSDANAQQSRQPLQTIKSWDADLRQSLDIPDNEPKPREKLRKRNTKSNMDEIKTTTDTEEKLKQKSEPSSQTKMNKNKLSPITESDNSICNIKVLKTNLTETITIDKKGVTKKYAKLKTLATNIKRIDKNDRSILSNISVSGEVSERSIELTKHLPQNSSSIAMELETPRKNEITLGIPPTPRVLSPSHSTPFIQVTEDSGKVRCFITTPEFPATPCINLTPTRALENTADTTNGEFSALYYHPSNELKKNPISQNQHDKTKPNKPEITQFEVIKENLPKDEACKELNISINSKDSEALQLTKNTIEDTKETIDDSKTNKSTENSATTLSDSSDSESDTTSSSCSSSSCSCNDDTTNNSSRMSTSRRFKDTPNTIEMQTSVTSSVPKIIDKTSDERLVNSCERSERQIARVVPLDSTPCEQRESNQNQNVLWKKNESSPEKVFPIVKTQQALDDADTETPAKDENLLCEAEISETPSGSKSGIETLTNLTSKISAFIVAKEPASRKYHGSLRKLDAKLSVDSVKTNILESLSNPGGESRLEKESLVTRKVIEVAKSNQNVQEQESETLSEKNGRIKSIEESTAECSLKLRLKSTGQVTEQTDNQNALRKSKKEIKIAAKNNIPGKKSIQEEKPIGKDEISKKDVESDVKDSIVPITSAPTNPANKSSIDDATVESHAPEKSELLSTNNSDPQTLPFSEENIEVNSTTSKAELSVLESLKLVPASKIEVVENPDANSSRLSQNCHREFSFIHDDAINTKKRNVKKFGPSDLEFAIQLRNDEFATMTASRFEILFTLPSKSVRARQTRKPKLEAKTETKSAKPTIRSIKVLKGATVTKTSKLPPTSTVVSQPLATSSPVQVETIPKVTGKVKATSENIDEFINKPKNTKPDVKKQSMTTRKRKERSESKDDEPTEKKAAVTNPKLLLSRVNIDEFLTTVHGPVTKS